MGLYDREYQKNSFRNAGFYVGGGFFSSYPPVTRCIIIINILVFLIMLLVGISQKYILQFFSIYPSNWVNQLQLWRLISYQFIHASFWHILFNMLMLSFLGPKVEYIMGSRKYLFFYLISGAAGGIVYTLLVMAGLLHSGMMVGASGAIYSMMAVAALMFPNEMISIWGLITLNMKTFFVIAVALSCLNFVTGSNAGGEAAHLTGIAVGVSYIYLMPRFSEWKMKTKKGAWEKKIQKQRDFENNVDQILDKIHREGIGSLTRKEKEILQQATKNERQNNTH